MRQPDRCRGSISVWQMPSVHGAQSETACPPPSPDRARSSARVSEKREYFKCRPETIGDFAPKLFKFGV